VPVAYAVTGFLNQFGRVQSNSIGGGVGIVFNQSNPSSSPLALGFTGTVPPGEYRVFIAAGLGASNLPNGVNSYVRSGSFESVVFTVQVPEAGTGAIWIVITLVAAARRKRCAGAD